MYNTIKEVLAFIEENDVQFVRLAFCDMHGQQKNISIMAEELPAAFENGISFDAHAIRGFNDITKSDLLLFPDPATLAVLPWRPGPGHVVRFFCDICNPDGTMFEHDCRYLLRQVVSRCEKKGYVCKIGAECEFYLFKTDENGEPTEVPFDKGGYLDISPLDKGENIRREICLSLKDMGIQPEASHHEQGPGQNEIDFRFSEALSCADNLLTFRAVVKAIALRNGLFASFMPKPIFSAPGSGMHVNLSLSQNGFNIFKNTQGEHSKTAESFIAGILSKTAEISLFLNPLVNSYARFGEFEAPKYVTWSHQNRSQLVRIPAAFGERVRMELRSPDSSMNPYLGFALILSAGLDGIESALPLPPATNLDLYNASPADLVSLPLLPQSFDEAISLAEKSAFAEKVLGRNFLQKYINAKKEESAAAKASADLESFYSSHYFPII